MAPAAPALVGDATAAADVAGDVAPPAGAFSCRVWGSVAVDGAGEREARAVGGLGVAGGGAMVLKGR
jgi:hypothetical protein